MKNVNSNDVKSAAKHYRDVLGFNVIPLRAGSKAAALPKNHPYLYRPATAEEFENFEFRNVAIITGELSNIIVVDEDEKGALEARGWRVPVTATVKTARGYHYYFKHPGFRVRNRTGKNALAPGVELKGDGGYVVTPPSVVVSTVNEKGINWPEEHAYEWVLRPEDVGVAFCPAWLLDELQKRPEHTSNVDLTAPIEDGERNSELTRRAGKLTRVLEPKLAREVLHFINERFCRSPLPPDEVDGITLYENEQVSPSSSLIGNDSDDTLPEVRRFKDMTRPKGPRPHIVDGVLFEGFPGAIYGDGGSAKSMLVMHMGQCVARGEKWLGFDTVKTKVMYLDFELDGEEQARRAYQVASGMGYTEPPEGFYYLSAAGYPTRPMFDHALKECKERSISMVIVDSLGYALEGDAEASRDVLKFFREVEGAFRREGITLLIVDHQSKHGNYQEKTMFGSVYKTNSIRSVFQVEPGEHDDGFINLTVRHKKANFGPLLKPFGVEAAFVNDEGEVEVKEVQVRTRELDATELAEEGTLNAKDRVLMALEDGSMYPADIADATGLELGTVKNALTALRKAKEVEDTGEKDRSGAHQVRKVSSPSPSFGDDDSDTYPDHQQEVVGLAS